MSNPLISVIMSTYNESRAELRKSVESILNQSYSNIQVVIINDNPRNVETKEYLETVQDHRVEIYTNDKNVGLVASLNRALSYTRGEFIARMDADDIAELCRIEKQLQYLCSKNLDMVGCDICLIDVEDRVVKRRMHFPESNQKVKKYIAWGSCLAHPTWLVKREVYQTLNGYRNVPYCEDYDFLLRVIAMPEYKVGNAPIIGLKYRIRDNSLSASNNVRQYVLRRYLSKNRDRISALSSESINKYIISKEFIGEIQICEMYFQIRNKCRKTPLLLLHLPFNKYFYYRLFENIVLLLRNQA